MLNRISFVLVLVLVATVCANEMMAKFCLIIGSEGGVAKLQECGKKAPKRGQEIPLECKKELGYEAISLQEYSEKFCDPKEKDLHQKVEECNTKKFMDAIEKEDDFIAKCQPFIECMGS